MTRPMLDTPPLYSFTEAKLSAAHKVAEPWAGLDDLFWTMAVTALLDRAATEDEVAHFRPIIRQAVEEAGA